MITNDPNTNLIEAMKEKLPLKGKLADMLMDNLQLDKEGRADSVSFKESSLYRQRSRI